MTHTQLLHGIPVSPGTAIGALFLLPTAPLAADGDGDGVFRGVDAEKARLRTAIAQARQALAALRDDVAARLGGDEAAIFEMHDAILTDPDVLDAAAEQIAAGQNAAAAWRATLATRADDIRRLNDPQLAARADDIDDVATRVLRLLAGDDANVADSLPDGPLIVVARDVSPSDVARLARHGIAGLCIAAGGPASHSAILARSLGIPAVAAVGERALSLQSGATAILNGDDGVLLANPAPDQLADAARAREAWLARRAQAERAAQAPAITLDGQAIRVTANVGSLADAEAAARAGADGIGLVRTEFLFVDSVGEPSEQNQYAAYRDIVAAQRGNVVTVRALDTGGDKPVSYVNLPSENNPLLGERGIRLLLARPEMFQRQLRALLRAAAHGPLRILLPMLTDIGEWRAARAALETARHELNTPPVQLGVMIEVPAAALLADTLAGEVDFFSIGSNDLTQYALAIDRQHPLLAARADALHPAVLRLVAGVTGAARRAGKPVSVCGEIAADPRATALLIGLGVDELSVSPPAVAAVKMAVRNITFDRAAALARNALTCATAAEVRALIAGASADANTGDTRRA